MHGKQRSATRGRPGEFQEETTVDEMCAGRRVGAAATDEEAPVLRTHTAWAVTRGRRSAMINLDFALYIAAHDTFFAVAWVRARSGRAGRE